jgi:hypothetical protein
MVEFSQKHREAGLKERGELKNATVVTIEARVKGNNTEEAG